MMNNIWRTGFFQPLARMKRKNPGKQKTGFLRDADGWWANRKLGEDNILGYGKTKEEALSDLENQVAGFLDFLETTQGNVPESRRQREAIPSADFEGLRPSRRTQNDE
jgi:hypothetical protein